MNARIVVGAAIVLCCACGSDNTASGDASDDGVADVVAVDASDEPEAGPPMCDPGAKTGVSGNPVKTTGNEAVIVRAGASYDPTIAAPLIVVYAGCCVDGKTMELFTGFTTPATTRGYLVAYVDHITPGPAAATADAASAIAAVEDRFCVDTAHVFLTGHSDGGSLTELITISNTITPAAIAPSASGLLASQLGTTACPKASPIPDFDMHSSGDQLFPITSGYGKPMADWFAKCDGCGATGTALANGCLPYMCNDNTQVLYCQGTAAHGVWPGLTNDILDFFDQYR